MKRILIIEDDVDVRNSIQDILLLEKFDVVTAANGKVGVILAQEKAPELIICDVMMPKLNGHQVLKTLRQDASTASIPFIFLSAKSTQRDYRHGMELGADDYLTKPFTPGDLLRAIATRLEKQSAIAQQVQERIDRLCSNIALSLPHEINTPLNGILGLTQMLMTTYETLPEEEMSEILDAIYSSGERLYQLSQNFLLYTDLEMIARTPEKTTALQRKQVRSSTTAAIVDAATAEALNANRETDMLLNLQDAVVCISHLKLQKIVKELVSNAFKSSPSGTTVQVVSHTANQQFCLYIIDHGYGFTEHQLATIGAYMQFDRKQHEQQGVGLGLIIAKRMIELHGGDLQIESIPHKQTIVRVMLPVWKS